MLEVFRTLVNEDESGVQEEGNDEKDESKSKDFHSKRSWECQFYQIYFWAPVSCKI